MRTPKPHHKHIGKGWNAKGRGWYVNLGGRTTHLATEEEGEEVAQIRYHGRMTGLQPVKMDAPVADLLDRFLDHHKSTSADSTCEFYKTGLDSFASFIGPKLRICDLKPARVPDWRGSRTIPYKDLVTSCVAASKGHTALCG